MARPRVRQDKKRGTWIVEYYDKDKKQHRLKGFPTKRAANDKASEIEGEMRQGIHTPASKSATVADACSTWIERARDLRLERRTVAQYENHTDLHITPLTDNGERPAWEGKLGDLKLSKLNPPIAKAVQRELVRRLSPALARKVMVSFKATLTEAATHGMISYNPASTVKTERRKRGEHKVHAGVDFPTKEELNLVIAKMEGRWRPLILVLAFCGLRASELRGLEWIDVMGLNSDFPQLRVRQRADQDGKIGDTKTDAAHRHIPLTPLLVRELRAWQKICPRDPETGKLRYVFPNGAGNIENHANISNRGWDAWQIRAGLCEPRRDAEGKLIKDREGRAVMQAKYGVHALRHFFASLMIDRGFNHKRVQTLMGHSTIQMTLNVYAHLFKADEADDRERFADAEASVLMAEPGAA